MTIIPLTSSIKKCNLILNIAVFLFTIISLCLLIGYLFFLNTNLFQYILLKLIISGLALLLIGLTLSVLRDNLKRKKTFSVNYNYKIEINSKKHISLINNVNDISYARNYLVTDNKQKFEIDNSVAFFILNHELITNAEQVIRNTNILEMNPDKVVERIRSILSNGIFMGGLK